jgi:AraC family transcriptional regulator
MNDAAQTAVERVIKYMYDNLAEEITIDDMARTAMFSKFHFSRIFRAVTGISPGRFLSAIRLQAAKCLLVSTSLSVTDICFQAGYNSVGTFSSRFAAVVGIPPTVYRDNGGYIPRLAINARRNDWGSSSSAIRGHIISPSPGPGPGPGPGPDDLIFIGVFSDPIIQGKPIRYTVCAATEVYQLGGVPPGTWYLLGYSFTREDNRVLLNSASDSQPPSVAVHGPITVGSRPVIRNVDMTMRPMRVIDPPMLLAVLDVGLRKRVKQTAS